jgi:hypothetical protein
MNYTFIKKILSNMLSIIHTGFMYWWHLPNPSGVKLLFKITILTIRFSPFVLKKFIRFFYQKCLLTVNLLISGCYHLCILVQPVFACSFVTILGTVLLGFTLVVFIHWELNTPYYTFTVGDWFFTNGVNVPIKISSPSKMTQEIIEKSVPKLTTVPSTNPDYSGVLVTTTVCLVVGLVGAVAITILSR